MTRLRHLRFLLLEGDEQGTGDEERVTMPRGEDQERVYSLVCRYDGRVRQGTLIEETGCGPSKASRLLQEMEREGCIGRVAVGREKIVTLPVPDTSGEE